MKLYLTVSPFTLTNIETQEVSRFDNLDNLLEAAITKSADIYVFELNKLISVFAKKFIDYGYDSVSLADVKSIIGAIPTKSFLSVATSEDATVLRVRRNQKVQVKFFNASKLFGRATVNDIISSVGQTEENLGMALAIKGLMDKGHTAWTLSGNALNDLKKRCFFNITSKGKNATKLRFENRFPRLDSEVHNFVMSSFQGGICHFNPKYKGQVVKGLGTEYDVNSMYPAVMEQEYLPFGAATRFEGKYKKDLDRPVYFQEVSIKKLKLRRKGVPCIKSREGHGYYTDETNLTLVLNHIDLEMMFDNYKVRGLKYNGGYKFRAIKGIFDNYINYWKEEKIKATEEGNAFNRMIAKMMLNAAFGKFATRTDKKSIQYKLTRSGKIASFVEVNAEQGNSVYAPVGAYITSYARQRLLNAIRANGKNFVYSDTDSIYILGSKAKGLEIDDTKFGAWKKEFTWNKMYIVGKKQYIVEKEDKTLKVVCAGMPAEALEQVKEFDDFTLGSVFSFHIDTFDAEGIKGTELQYKELKDEEI